MRSIRFGACLIAVLLAKAAAAGPVGFVKWTVPLDGPPAGLAFDAAGVLYALESADFGSNQATLRAILPDGTSGESFPVVGDDPNNFFVGGMAYDPLGDRLLVTDNTADGRLYAIDTTGTRETLATGIAAIAGVAVRGSGEIFVSTALGPGAGTVLQVDPAGGATSGVLTGLDYGAGLAFDAAGDLLVQDADATTFRGRLQRLPITAAPGGLEFGAAVPLLDDMQSAAGVVATSAGDLFTTGSGGLFRVAGSPLAEMSFDDNGDPFQFATAIAFAPGMRPFEPFAGPDAGRLAYLADFGFATQDTFITLLTPALPGDYNGDGSVDEHDYALWKSTFGASADLHADGNLSGTVDAADYTLWRDHLGGTLTSLTPEAVHVPEPPIFILIGLVLMLPVTLRRILPRSTKHAAVLESVRARP